MVSEELQKLFDIRKYMQGQREEFNKIYDTIQTKLDEAYPEPFKGGGLEVNLRELVKEAGCKLDFEVPEVIISINKSWNPSYFPNHFMASSFFEMRDDSIHTHKDIEAKLKDRLDFYSTEQKPMFLYAHMAIPLLQKTLEKFFSEQDNSNLPPASS